MTENSKKTMTPLIYVLLALIPYTKPNQKLAYKPSLFFNDLEKLSGYSNKSLRSACRNATLKKLVSFQDASIKISLAGRQKLQPFIAHTLGNNAQLMVIFDIPEEMAGTRKKFRTLLIMLGFRQVQQSVLTSPYDHRQILTETIIELGLEEFVQLYEADQIHLH